VEHLSFEDHLGRLVRELVGEAQGGFIESALEWCVLWTLETYSPLEQILVFETD
jgi:hypothetical protein